MKTSILLAAGAAALLATAAQAQTYAPASATTTTVVTTGGGDYTLKQREEWLNDHINKAHDERDIDGHEADREHHELNRIRDQENDLRGHQDGQLTDNQTQTLEARLDEMAAQIHWAHDNAFQKPW